MKYRVGGKIISKKPHACGGNQWEIVRIGADVKLKCLECERAIFISYDKVDKMLKKYIDLEEK